VELLLKHPPMTSRGLFSECFRHENQKPRASMGSESSSGILFFVLFSCYDDEVRRRLRARSWPWNNHVRDSINQQQQQLYSYTVTPPGHYSSVHPPGLFKQRLAALPGFMHAVLVAVRDYYLIDCSHCCP
jgi:hypothetical protein